jgi:hypothetical protein
MHWITRERPKVGRIGCAWLIRRYVDQDATFHFVPGPQLEAEAQRLLATPFHVDGSALSREGMTSSFERVIEHFKLGDDPALQLLARIVNTADITRSPFQQPEGAGLRAILDGCLLLDADDHAVLAMGMQIYDAMFVYCQDMVRRGKPHGALKQAAGGATEG